MMKTRRISSFMLALVMMLSLLFTSVTPVSAEDQSNSGSNGVIVMYTNDVHNSYLHTEKDGVATNIGYDMVAGIKKLAKQYFDDAFLVDCGDAIQGAQIGTLSKGEYLVDIMNQVGYDFAVPGNHEFDYGMDRFLELADKATYKYLSCNFSNADGSSVFDSYEIKEVNGYKIAFVGICTPETFTKSTPTYFQDANGNYIYGFCEGNNGQDLYDRVQATVNAAIAEGADSVIAIAHLGIDSQSQPWTSREVIANTSGIDVVLDGHSHSEIEEEIVINKAGAPVILSSTGEKLNNLGMLHLNYDGSIDTVLVPASDIKNLSDADTAALLEKYTEQVNEVSKVVVASTDFKLYTKDPVTGNRIVRSQETNLGDLCADAYRTMLDADIAFVNGGGIRADLNAGDITYGDIIAVHPFGNAACLIEATGQQILDALEMSARAASAEKISENGGFLQVSGLTYDIDTTIESTVVVNDKKEFVEVAGARRVKNVMVGGVAIDPNKTYKLASHNYMLKSGGDGYSMFKGNTILRDEVMLDNEVLINYIKDYMNGKVSAKYANPYGEGRIRVITAEEGDTYTIWQGEEKVVVNKVVAPAEDPKKDDKDEEVKPEEKKESVVPANQDEVQGIKDEKKTPAPAEKAPTTGDSTNVAAVVAILLLGVSSLAIAAKKKKDKDKEKEN